MNLSKTYLHKGSHNTPRLSVSSYLPPPPLDCHRQFFSSFFWRNGGPLLKAYSILQSVTINVAPSFALGIDSYPWFQAFLYVHYYTPGPKRVWPTGGFSTFLHTSVRPSVCMYAFTLISFIHHGQYTFDPQDLFNDSEPPPNYCINNC